MKYVEVIQDQLITYETKTNNKFDTEIWTFYKFMVHIVLNDPAMGRGYPYLKARKSIQSKFEPASVGDWVALEDDQWMLIRNTLVEPQGSPVSLILPLSVHQQFLPFAESIVEPDRVKDKHPLVTEN